MKNVGCANEVMTMDIQKSILIVEDDIDLAELICDYLSRFTYQMEHITNGLDAVAFIQKKRPDLIILDLMLPGLNGLDVCKSIRGHYHGAILMLTACDGNVDEILGLEVGADDFLTKPVVPQRLRARISALLRRTQSYHQRLLYDSSAPLCFGDIKIFEKSRIVKIKNKEIQLSTPEYDLLLLLVCRHGEIVSRELIFQELKGVAYDGTDRSIDILISYLRAKLCNPSMIRTVRGKGYLFSTNSYSEQ